MRGRWWALPAVLAAVAAVLASGALVAGRTPAEPPPAAFRPTTPVLSVRRAPAVLQRFVADLRLEHSLDQLLSGRDRSCLVVREGHRTLYRQRPDLALIPASTMKVLTALVVLRKLGSDFRYATEARAEGGIGADGAVDRLWLVGSGDPILATGDYAATFGNQPQVFTPLELLADGLVQAGLKAVRNGVAGDESRYDTTRYVPSWKPSYVSDSEVGPLSALAVNDGFAQFGSRHVAAAAPATNAAAVLTALLQARGVVVGGNPGEGVAPEGAVEVATVESPPLREVVGEMLRESDNNTAEMLTKELGARFGGGGTWAAGTGVVRSTVAEIGLPVDGFSAVDGSGLDRSDRITCSMLMAAVDLEQAALVPGFAVAGQSGTLSKRFVGNPAAGRLKAKTGSLDNVAGLVGVIEPPAGGLLEFALLANELPDRQAAGRALQERLGAVLARYPEAPAVEELAPR